MSKNNDRESCSSENDEEEQPEEYCIGGYHPVHVGDNFQDGRYKVCVEIAIRHRWCASSDGATFQQYGSHTTQSKPSFQNSPRLNKPVALKIVKS